MVDVLFINPNSSKKTYQSLSNRFSAIEPPTWSLLLASSCRSIGFKVNILDANAENLTNFEVLDRIIQINPRFL